MRLFFRARDSSADAIAVLISKFVTSPSDLEMIAPPSAVSDEREIPPIEKYARLI